MSKTTVTKALENFNEPELRRLILDIYSKSKEAKELLDFYAEPALDAKLDQLCKQADKELFRRKSHAFRPRSNVLRSIVKKFKIFEPDDEYVGRLMVHIATGFINISELDTLPDNVYIQAIKWFEITLEFIDNRRMVDIFIPQLRREVEQMRVSKSTCPTPLRKELLHLLEPFADILG